MLRVFSMCLHPSVQLSRSPKQVPSFVLGRNVNGCDRPELLRGGGLSNPSSCPATPASAERCRRAWSLVDRPVPLALASQQRCSSKMYCYASASCRHCSSAEGRYGTLTQKPAISTGSLLSGLSPTIGSSRSGTCAAASKDHPLGHDQVGAARQEDPSPPRIRPQHEPDNGRQRRRQVVRDTARAWWSLKAIAFMNS